MENESFFYELATAYFDCRFHKRNTINALKFEINQFQELYKLFLDLVNGSYEIGRSIAFVYSNDGNYREVFAADFRDRIVHHLLINRVLPYIEEFEWIDDSYSTREGKGTLYGINRLAEQIQIVTDNYQKEVWILKMDLKACFTSVNKDILWEKFSNFLIKIYKEKDISNERLQFDLNLTKLIISNKPQENCIRKSSLETWKHIPDHKTMFKIPKNKNQGFAVGNLTSQILVNFILSSLDHFIVDNLGFDIKYKNEAYGRYVDDFYLLSQRKYRLLKAKKLIIKFCKEVLDITVSPTKIYMQPISHGVNFIGACIKPGRIYILNRSIQRFIKKLKDWKRYIEILNKEDIDPPYIEMEYFSTVVNSYLGTMQKFKTFKIRQKLFEDDNFFECWKPFIDIDKNYKKIKIKNIEKIKNNLIEEIKFIKINNQKYMDFKFNIQHINVDEFINNNILLKPKLNDNIWTIYKLDTIL